MEHVDYDFMAGMTEEEVFEYLQSATTGVLALARDGEAYAVPISFEREAGSLFVRLAREGDSKKFEFLAETTEASFVVYDTPEDGPDWSIVATGTLREVTGDQEIEFDDAHVNEVFGPMHLFDQSVEDVDVVVYELQIETLTGRRTNEWG